LTIADVASSVRRLDAFLLQGHRSAFVDKYTAPPCEEGRGLLLGRPGGNNKMRSLRRAEKSNVPIRRPGWSAPASRPPLGRFLATPLL
jgi:hypothetical protein